MPPCSPSSRGGEPRLPSLSPEGRDTDAAGATPLAAAACCVLARHIASAMLDVPVAEIARPNRSFAETCRARHVAMYLAHVVLQVPLAGIAAHFGRDRTSVAHGIRRIEDLRDEPGFDALLTRLERLAGACGAILSGVPASADRTDGEAH